ncbi:hypothetical protein Tel_12425 [Candidatus Tenderia electrophaga]|jgi:hypothetical protein|uniref:DUF3096 domain-containing protein n=1 Tax=Candidatus Tenderia electrophaga TaxID=1748243 RepID=A0A0S2TFG8_9GAMM|nr:hypothetical protein Tel_12425 [Candidatus Tenderia electrophaga]
MCGAVPAAMMLLAINIGGWIMAMELYLNPLISVLAGILILVIPRFLNYIVAFYLIVSGVAGLMLHI